MGTIRIEFEDGEVMEIPDEAETRRRQLAASRGPRRAFNPRIGKFKGGAKWLDKLLVDCIEKGDAL